MIAPAARSCEFGCDQAPVIESVRVCYGYSSQNKLKSTWWARTNDQVWGNRANALTLNKPWRFFYRNSGSNIDGTGKKSNIDETDLDHVNFQEMNEHGNSYRWYLVPQAQRISRYANITDSICTVEPWASVSDMECRIRNAKVYNKMSVPVRTRLFDIHRRRIKEDIRKSDTLKICEGTADRWHRVLLRNCQIVSTCGKKLEAIAATSPLNLALAAMDR